MATKETPQKGDKVRVVLEGEVFPGTDGFYVCEDNGNKRHFVTTGSDCVKSIEILEKAKPEWWPLRDGDVFSYLGATRYIIGGRGHDAEDHVEDSSVDFYNRYADRVELLYRPASRTPGPEPF